MTIKSKMSDLKGSYATKVEFLYKFSKCLTNIQKGPSSFTVFIILKCNQMNGDSSEWGRTKMTKYVAVQIM